MGNFKMTSVEKVEVARDGVLVKDANGKDVIVDIKYTTSWFITEGISMEDKEALMLENTKRAVALLDELKNTKAKAKVEGSKVVNKPTPKKQSKSVFKKDVVETEKPKDTTPKFKSLTW